MPDGQTRAMRRRLARRSQLGRARTRAKNECHPVLVRRLITKPAVSDLVRPRRPRVAGRSTPRGRALRGRDKPDARARPAAVAAPRPHRPTRGGRLAPQRRARGRPRAVGGGAVCGTSARAAGTSVEDVDSERGSSASSEAGSASKVCSSQRAGQAGGGCRSRATCAGTSRPIACCRAAAARGLSSGCRRSGRFDASAVVDRARSAWRREGLEPITRECRHTGAAFMISAGVNVEAASAYMGHSSVTVTLDRYGHLMPGGEAEAAGCSTPTWPARARTEVSPAGPGLRESLRAAAKVMRATAGRMEAILAEDSHSEDETHGLTRWPQKLRSTGGTGWPWDSRGGTDRRQKTRVRASDPEPLVTSDRRPCG